jgi:hypothetical protein
MNGYEGITPATVISVIFWIVASCSSVKVHTHFGGTYWLHLQGRIVSKLQNKSERNCETANGRVTIKGTLLPLAVKSPSLGSLTFPWWLGLACARLQFSRAIRSACRLLLLASCSAYHAVLKIEAVCSFETSDSLRTTWRYNPKGPYSCQFPNFY